MLSAAHCAPDGGTVYDGAGNVILTGMGQGTMDFGGGPLTLPSGGAAVLAKFDGGGKYLWAKAFGAASGDAGVPANDAGVPANDAGVVQSSAGIAVATVFGSNQIVMAGNASGQIDFGMGPKTCPGDDVFVATFQP